MTYVAIILFILLSFLLLLVFLNSHLPKWFCDKMGWHLPPIAQGFDGCSYYGECPRCKERVLQDSQGNWF